MKSPRPLVGARFPSVTLRPIALWLALAGSLSAANAKLDTSTPVGQAFARLYNFDFPGAHAILDRQIRSDPQDSLPYAVKAAGYLFAELHRLKVLQTEFFEDDDRIVDRRKLNPDPAIRAEFFRLLEAARQRANARLAAHPGDRDALFTLCMAAGLVTDYAALVERRRFGSFPLARETQAYVDKLQLLKPPVYDAYLARGTTEYVVGSIPFIFRWFFHIQNIEGNKQRGIGTIQLVAERGRYYPPFARILLAAIAVREKRLTDAQRLLVGLVEEYPENPLTRRELARINELMRRGALDSGRAQWARLRDNEDMAQAIARDPETMHGVPVFRGTRVPVQTLFDYLAGGDTLEDFLEGFPTVSRAHALEALEEARGLLPARG